MSIVKIAQSSNIIKVKYNNETEILTITFKNENTYKYKKVPLNIVEEFKRAESPGKFFYKRIRNIYEFIKVE